MFALNRFVVGSERTAEFTEQAHAALAAFAARPGYRAGELVRSVDEPDHWCLTTHWDSIGAYRRALGDYRVRVEAVPLLAQAEPEPSAYEPLASAAPGEEVTVRESDRAGDRSPDHG